MNWPAIYQFKIEGHLSPEWAEWFGSLDIQWDANGSTSLVGWVQDEAALYGILNRFRDLNLSITSVQNFSTGTEDRE